MAAIFPATIDDDRADLRQRFDVEEARMRAAIAAMPPAEAIKAINAAIAEAERAGGARASRPGSCSCSP